MNDDAVRDANGWQAKGTYGEPRLSELAHMYRELGFEVRLEPFAPGESTECSQCMHGSADGYRTVYTRKKD